MIRSRYIQRRLGRQGIYLLPNLVTTSSLLCGFYAILKIFENNFSHASAAIFISIFLDGIDGRLARITSTQTAFGAEYDSLADMTSFGVAPAVLLYQFSLYRLGQWGYGIAVFFCICTALRLARFNIMREVTNKKYFQGLPTPAAAGFLISVVWLLVRHPKVYQIPSIYNAFSYLIIPILTVLTSLSMVSNIPFYSGKDLRGTRSVSFPFIVKLVIFSIFVSILSITFPELMFILSSLYLGSGYFIFFFTKKNKTRPFQSSDSEKSA